MYRQLAVHNSCWRYTTPPVHLVILWRSSTKAYICRRHCLHLSKTLQPAHEQTPPISTSHVRLLISFNTHQELNEKLIVQPEKDAPAKLTGCWGALLAVGLSSRSSSSGDASAMALSTSSMTSSSRTAAVLFRWKKKRAKRRSWFVPGPLKRGQEHFSCPLLSGPGTLSIHGRARMVYSGPCADVADWSMP